VKSVSAEALPAATVRGPGVGHKPSLGADLSALCPVGFAADRVRSDRRMSIHGLHAIPHFEQTAPSDRVFHTLAGGAPIASREAGFHPISLLGSRIAEFKQRASELAAHIDSARLVALRCEHSA
jgi:hypothetical protein